MADPASVPPTPPPNPQETIAGRARRMADLIAALPSTVVESFRFDDPAQRVSHLNSVIGCISVGMAPVIGWIERRRPAGTAQLVVSRMSTVLDEALGCASHDIPEYTGGTVARSDSDIRSPGACRTASLAVTARMVAASLVDWAAEIEAEEKQRTPRHAEPTIWSHGDGTYSRDGITSYCVTEEEDNILEAFLGVGKAMDTATLEEKSGSTNVSKVIKRLRENYNGIFADAVRVPGKKGAGGYFVLVRRAGS